MAFEKIQTSRLDRLLSQAEAIPRTKLPLSIKFKLWFYTLAYHSSFSFSYTVDTLLEPMFWFIDNFGKCLGRIFVAAVIILISIVVTVAHILGIPVWWYRSPPFTFVLFMIGYWILVNLLFNFIQAVRVSPGLPNDTQLLAKTMNVTICKKCISPKPPRTHHCSICNRCALNMCHHCPWVNNCIGHFNRRYFYLTMVYIVLGCLFVMLFGLEIGYQQVVRDHDVLPFNIINPETEGVTEETISANSLLQRLARRFSLALELVIPGNAIIASELQKPISDKEVEGKVEERARLLFGILVTRSELLMMIYFVALLCIGASLALGGLCVWHGKLIAKGETSIEYHINKAERKKIGSNFVNPYDLGVRRNWEIFFGLDQPGISVKRHILLPSAHVPTGNGYDWHHLTKRTLLNS